MSQAERVHFLQMFQMTAIAFVSVINHYYINELHVFWDTLYINGLYLFWDTLYFLSEEMKTWTDFTEEKINFWSIKIRRTFF